MFCLTVGEKNVYIQTSFKSRQKANDVGEPGGQRSRIRGRSSPARPSSQGRV